MRRHLQRASVIGGLALVGLLPIGATANASTPTSASTTATASAAPSESRICCFSRPYPTKAACDRARVKVPTAADHCYRRSDNGKWYFSYQ
jgi:hypothetical protein